MKTLTYYFSTISTVQGSILNGYFFVDPITLTSFSYPLTANGGNNQFNYSTSYSVTAFDGYFFPYGFNLNSQYINANYIIKGDYTVTFCPTALATNPIKMVYNFGDNSNLQIITQPLGNNLDFSNINAYLFGENFSSPKYQIISHNYYANSTPNTFAASITAINSDLTIEIFNVGFYQTPNSVYDIDKIHIIDAITQSYGNVNIIEVEKQNVITNLTTLPNSNAKYPIPYALPLLSALQTSGTSLLGTEKHLVFTLN